MKELISKIFKELKNLKLEEIKRVLLNNIDEMRRVSTEKQISGRNLTRNLLDVIFEKLLGTKNRMSDKLFDDFFNDLEPKLLESKNNPQKEKQTGKNNNNETKKEREFIAPELKTSNGLVLKMGDMLVPTGISKNGKTLLKKQHAETACPVNYKTERRKIKFMGKEIEGIGCKLDNYKARSDW